MNLRHSRQRDCIMQFLKTRKDHPTADVVYMNVRKTYPNISLGTIYRNLTQLVDIGEIVRIHAGDGVDRFDADTTAHCHFVCRECGSVTDLDVENMDFFLQTAAENFKGQIESHSTYFYGRCEKCCTALLP